MPKLLLVSQEKPFQISPPNQRPVRPSIYPNLPRRHSRLHRIPADRHQLPPACKFQWCSLAHSQSSAVVVAAPAPPAPPSPPGPDPQFPNAKYGAPFAIVVYPLSSLYRHRRQPPPLARRRKYDGCEGDRAGRRPRCIARQKPSRRWLCNLTFGRRPARHKGCSHASHVPKTRVIGRDDGFQRPDRDRNTVTVHAFVHGPSVRARSGTPVLQDAHPSPPPYSSARRTTSHGHTQACGIAALILSTARPRACLPDQDTQSTNIALCQRLTTAAFRRRPRARIIHSQVDPSPTLLTTSFRRTSYPGPAAHRPTSATGYTAGARSRPAR